MLIHIVVWKYREETSQDIRREHVESLKALDGIVPGMLRFEVGSDVLDLDRSYDTGLVAEFTGREALDEYTVHEAHQKVASMGKDISAHVASVDFLI